MLCQLAETYYERDTLFEEVIGGFSPPIIVGVVEDKDVISIPEVLSPDKLTVRGSSVALLALVESGDLDYAFEYESVAEQHDLRFLQLPQEIDLSSEDYSDWYDQVSVKMDFQRFGSVTPEFLGQRIIYGATIPSNSPNPEKAAEFLAFLLGEEGSRIFSETYHPLLEEPIVSNSDCLPASLRELGWLVMEDST